MPTFALFFFQIPPKGEVQIFIMYIITLQSLKAIAFILFELQITKDYGRSWAATRPAVTVGDAGKNTKKETICLDRYVKFYLPSKNTEQNLETM